MSVTPARFSPVSANPLPTAIKVNGITFGVGPLYSPWTGETLLPMDLLAGVNIAVSHISMALRLLELIEGLEPQEYKRRVHETRTESLEPGRWQSVPNEMANLA